MSRSEARLLAVLRAGGKFVSTWFPLLQDESGRRVRCGVTFADAKRLASLGLIEVAEERKLGDTFTQRFYRATFRPAGEKKDGEE